MTQSTAADSVERLRPIEDAASLLAALSAGRRCYIPPSVTSITLTSVQATTILPLLKMIDAESAVTINLPAMDLTLASTILAGGPLGQNITVKGATMDSTSITAATNTTPGAGAHEVTFTVTNSAIFTVGGFAIVKSIVGTGREKVLEGCWEVLAKPSGTTVRLKVKAYKSTLPTLTGISSGTMLAVGTLLRFAGITGLQVEGKAGIFQNMALIGDGNGTNVWGVYVSKAGSVLLSQSTSTPFAVVNFAEHGIYAIEGSFVSCFDSYSSGNGQGGCVIGDGSCANAVRLVATGNNTLGIAASNHAMIGATSANASGNNQRGLNAVGVSRLVATSSIVYENDDAGVRADTGGFIDCTSAKIAGNNGQGIRAFGGRVTAISADYTGGNTSANEQVEYNGTIDTTSTTQEHVNIAASRYTTSQTIADDAVYTHDMGSTSRNVTILIHLNVTGVNGLVHARTVTSVICESVVDNGITVTTGALAGTTGVDGEFTVSAHTDGKLYFENRLGGSRVVTIDIMGETT